MFLVLTDQSLAHCVSTGDKFNKKKLDQELQQPRKSSHH